MNKPYRDELLACSEKQATLARRLCDLEALHEGAAAGTTPIGTLTIDKATVTLDFAWSGAAKKLFNELLCVLIAETETEIMQRVATCDYIFEETLKNGENV